MTESRRSLPAIYEEAVALQESGKLDEARRLYAELHRNILDVFNEYKVQIMTPAYEGDP